MSGKLIVIEGIDGSGKSTQVTLLKERLERENIDFKYQRFPRYDKSSSELVRRYLNGDFGTNPNDVNPYLASTFFAVDRSAAFLEGLGDYYRSGGTLICDRYTTSNAVHQASKLDENIWDDFSQWLFDFEFVKLGLPEPDIVFFLDISVELGERMIKIRGLGEDIHEANIEYLRKSARAARHVSSRYNWIRIECERDGALRAPADISNEIYDKAKSLLLK